MKSVFTIFSLMVEAGVVVGCWIAMYTVLSLFFWQISSITPPGAQGLSAPYFLLVGLSLLLLFAFARTFQSVAPSVGAAFWIATGLSGIPFIDSRTPLRIRYGATIWDTYRPALVCGVVVLALLLGAVYAARIRRITNHQL